MPQTKRLPVYLDNWFDRAYLVYNDYKGNLSPFFCLMVTRAPGAELSDVHYAHRLINETEPGFYS